MFLLMLKRSKVRFNAAHSLISIGFLVVSFISVTHAASNLDAELVVGLAGRHVTSVLQLKQKLVIVGS